MDLHEKNRLSPKLELRQLRLLLNKDRLIYERIMLNKTEALLNAESFDIQMRELEERMDIRKKQIEYLEAKITND